LKSVILNVAKQLGLFAVASSITRAEIRIIAYHGIWFRDGHFGNHLFRSPENFSVAKLLAHGVEIPGRSAWPGAGWAQNP